MKPPIDRKRGARIKHVRDLLGLTQDQFAVALGLGVTRGAIGNWELGKGILLEHLALISKKTGAPLTWLANNDGRAPRSKEELRDFGREGDADRPLFNAVSTERPYAGVLRNAIPDIETVAGAGPGQDAEFAIVSVGDGVTYGGNAVRGEIVLPDYLLAELTPASAGQVHAVRVRGDSMETTLFSGDRVFVDTTDTALGQGGVFVIFDRRYNEVLVKRLRRIGKGDRMKIEIASDNPKQGPDTADQDEIRIIGRAVARLTRL